MPSKEKVTYGSTVKKRAKRLLEALLAYVNWELEDVGVISLSHKWQDETTDQPKLVIETQLRTLEFLTAKDKYEGHLTKDQIRQALNQHLKSFLQILEDNRAKDRGEEDWHFTLKLWSKDKEKNLEQFEIEWENKRPKKSKQQEETLRETVVETFQATSLPKDEGINWQEICRQNLALQKELTTNPFTNANGVTPQLDDIYVPLAIVERKPPKPPSSNQPEEKEEEKKEEEKLIPIAEERFFEDVLRQGKSESQGRKIAIIGEPGAGKTTRLQKIADWILEQDLGLPIWISLADLTQPTISQYIEEIWLKQTGKSLTIDELTQQKDRIWLLLDGLDEMTSRVEMRHVSALLGGWVQAARVVVTCRVNVWEADKNAFSGFDVFRNLEFNPEQVTDYICRWFAAMGDAATGESLEAALAESENSRLKELIQNPLRLWMLCQIWQTGGGLPETQAGLYGQFVDWVYDWKADEEILNQREAIDKALVRLALAAMEQNDEVSRLRLRESWVLKVLGSRPIFQAVMKLGWLNRVERFPEAICVFYHATFQEYFAALAVDDWDYFLPRNHVNFPVAGKEYRIFEPQWKQVILSWLGREDVADEEKEDFIEALVNFDDGCGEWNFEEVDRGFYEYRAYFLAASGTSEFKTCSLADAIIQKLVKWGFGYFNEEKQEWRIFLKFITNSTRETLLNTYRKRTIQELCYLIEKSQCPESNRRQAAHSLGEIGQGNADAMTGLLKLLETTKNEDTRRRAAWSLGEIGQGNADTITELLKLLETTENGLTHRRVAESLEKIGQGHPYAITGLVKLLETTENIYTRCQVAKSLEKIGQGHPYAIDRLLKLLETTENRITRRWAAESLEKIGQGHLDAITGLVKLLKTSGNEDIRRQAVRSLGKIGQGNADAITELLKLLETTENGLTRRRAAESLGKIKPGNAESITRFLNFLETTYENEWIPWKAAESLEQISPSNADTITHLLEVLQTSNDEDTRIQAVWSLGETGQGNPDAIAELLELLKTSKDIGIRKQAAESLGKILSTDEQRKNVTSSLQSYLNDDKHKKDIFKRCYQVLWNIAQDLPYPDFYRAWHGLTETQTSHLVQTLNLPQLLQTQLTETNLHQTLQLLCIDGSKFDNLDNPAPDIYLQLLKKHHCPKSTEGTPRTLTELKIYWQLLDWEKHPILIFYEAGIPQGWSQTFLASLTRFDATICVITDSPHPTIPTFSPQDPHLIQTIITWLQRTILES